MKIETWPDIAAGFTNSVILGNGASIAVSSKFSYTSLLAEARLARRLSPGVEALFSRFATSDFELILELLWHAQLVNECLSIPAGAAAAEYQNLRAALIDTVRSHHASYEEVSPAFQQVHDFLGNFTTVISLNYDLVVYWSILSDNQKRGIHFKDGFLNGVFEEDWKRFRAAISADRVTMVFYPHGNLALAAALDGEEQKLHASGISLLDTVIAAWQSGEYRPVFVAEGETDQKLAAIRRSPYLNRVYSEVLPTLGESVAVFGWAARENDTHILRQISRNVRRLAFSVFRGARTEGEIDAECLGIRSRVAQLNPGAEVVFYWSA